MGMISVRPWPGLSALDAARVEFHGGVAPDHDVVGCGLTVFFRAVIRQALKAGGLPCSVDELQRRFAE
jgi:hypothetical protein